MAPRFVTLGPSGTCHEHATTRFVAFQELTTATITLTNDMGEAVAMLLAGAADFLVRNSEHPEWPNLHGKHYRELFLVATFICPTHHLALLTRRDVAAPKALGLMPA